MEDFLFLILGAALIMLCIYIRKQRSKNNVSNCPKCGTPTHADGSVKLMRGGSYIHNYKCPKCGFKWND
jgi:predicted RNA-binding Zn-ribbon protein involved in translation (DUF1610 family)